VNPGENLDQCRFASTILACDRVNGTIENLEVDLVQRQLSAEPHVDTVDGDRRVRLTGTYRHNSRSDWLTAPQTSSLLGH
jgi:hypothetical protein